METLFKDIRYGFRGLIKHPGFTTIAVVTLALGIGANTAIFSVVNSVLLQPLPFPQSERLAVLHRDEASSISYPDFLDMRDQTRSFEALALFRRESFNLSGVGDPERVLARMVSAEFFDLLGMRPMVGRDFRRDEDRLGADAVVLLSESLWRRRFAADEGVLGKSITLSGRDYTVIGVVPEMSRFFSRSDVYTLIGQWDEAKFRQRGTGFGTAAIGRLRPDVNLPEVRNDLDRLAHNLASTYPKEDHGTRFTLLPLREAAVGGLQRVLMLFLGAVGF